MFPKTIFTNKKENIMEDYSEMSLNELKEEAKKR